MDKTDILRLKSIIAYCDDIERQYERFGDTLEAFVTDRDYYYALSMCLYQISELIIRIQSPELSARINRKLPWHEIKAFRNVLAHGYGTVNNDLLWTTAREDIPKVRTLCYELLSESGL